MAEEVASSTFEFKAEIKQLLNILVHSLYTNREIFLRELVSNASDALDKLRFETNRGAEVADPDRELEIKITADEDAHLLTIEDSGVGMTQDEVIENIGTIARSGSAKFLEGLGDDKAQLDNLIGRFGVGFYSIFMVAEQVELVTRSFRPDAEPVRWRSDGLGTYELLPVDGEVPRGTRIELKLREDATEFASSWRLQSIIKQHSNFVSFPILVGEERINTVPALWREPRFNIKEEQYTEFYRFLTHDSGEPFDTLHKSVDAPVQFNTILFVPKSTDYNPGFHWEQPGLDLYAQRVLIQKGNKDLLPDYLGFVRGVVDSEDLPLNISRETLQENVLLKKISSNIVKQLLSHLQAMAKDEPERYEELWRAHGNLFKMGYGDWGNREAWGELLRFDSSAEPGAEQPAQVSLAQYVERAPEDSKKIYYVLGANRATIELNPHLEIFRKKGVEVLYLYHPVDEFALESLRTYKDHELQSVEHADLTALNELPTPEDSEEAKSELAPLSDEDGKEFDKLLGRIGQILGDQVTEVKVSTRLQESACCLVSPDGSMTSSMQKLLKVVQKDHSVPKKVFEVNRDHKLIRDLLTIYKRDPQDDHIVLVAEQLYESALLLEGYLEDPHALVGRVQTLLERSSAWHAKG